MPHALVGAKVIPPSPPMSSISGANAMNYAQQMQQQQQYGGGAGDTSMSANPKLTLPQAMHLISMRVTSIEKILAKEGMLKMMSDGTYEHHERGGGADSHRDGSADPMSSSSNGNGSGSSSGRIRTDDLHMVLNRLNSVESSLSDLTRDVSAVKTSTSAGTGTSTNAGTTARNAIPPAVIQQLNAFKQGFQKQTTIIKQLSDELKATQARVTDLEADIDSLSETVTQLMNAEQMRDNTINEHGGDAVLEGEGAGEGDSELGVGMGIALEPYSPYIAGVTDAPSASISSGCGRDDTELDLGLDMSDLNEL